MFDQVANAMMFSRKYAKVSVTSILQRYYGAI